MPVKVTVNGEPAVFPEGISPIAVNGRTYVPARFVLHPQIQGEYDLYEDEGRYELNVSGPLSLLFFSFGEQDPRFKILGNDDENMRLRELRGAVPFLRGEEPMIPLREAAEELGLEVGWDNASKTALVTSDETYRAELSSSEEWAEQVGQLPVDWDETEASAITEEELLAYIKEKGLKIADYKLDGKYAAVVLEVGEGEASTYGIRRLQSGELGREDILIYTGADEEGVSVKRSHGYLAVAIHDKAKKHRITSCVVSVTEDGVARKLKFPLEEGGNGYLIPIGDKIQAGLVNLYGEDGFVYEKMFW